jgi:hypothetical protein
MSIIKNINPYNIMITRNIEIFRFVFLSPAGGGRGWILLLGPCRLSLSPSAFILARIKQGVKIYKSRSLVILMNRDIHLNYFIYCQVEDKIKSWELFIIEIIIPMIR